MALLLGWLFSLATIASLWWLARRNHKQGWRPLRRESWFPEYLEEHPPLGEAGHMEQLLRLNEVLAAHAAHDKKSQTEPSSTR